MHCTSANFLALGSLGTTRCFVASAVSGEDGCLPHGVAEEEGCSDSSEGARDAQIVLFTWGKSKTSIFCSAIESYGHHSQMSFQMEVEIEYRNEEKFGKESRLLLF